MHTKRELEMVCTGLPEAILISSTALTMTRMAVSQTALWGILARVGAVQLVETTSRLIKRDFQFTPVTSTICAY